MNVIGDIAGQYDSLMRLIAKMPKQPTILLGDLNDRGWQSKQVIQWAIDNDVANGGLVETLDSNHGDLLYDWFMQKTHKISLEPIVDGFSVKTSLDGYRPRYDGYEIFEYNGGRPTMTSYGHNISRCFEDELLANEDLVRHVKWLSERPTHLLKEINGQKYVFTHAPMNPNIHRSFEQFLKRGTGFVVYDDDSRQNYQWNRYEPFDFHRDLPDTISVFGHNSGKDLKLICDQYRDGIFVKGDDKLRSLFEQNKGEIYGLCLDTSRDEKLTGLDLATMTLYHEAYMPEPARMY